MLDKSALQIVENRVPENWREVALSAVADVRFSSVDKLTYPSEVPVRLCNYIDVYKNDYITGDLEFKRASATQLEIDRFALQVGDVLITKDSETPDDIGVPAVVDYAAPDLICGYHLGLIRPRKDEVDPTFLAKQFDHQRIARYFGRQANGLTRYGLPLGAVTGTPLWLPNLREQKAIGALLRIVDAAIAQTEAVIAKLKQIRGGLLHDLLTRGLDEHGQLRPASSEVPHLYKDSPLGRIPREWGVQQLQELVPQNRRITYGIVQPGEFDPNGVLLIRGQDYISGWALRESFFKVNPSRHESYRRSLTRAGDLLVCIVGATTGAVACVPQWIDEANITQTTARVACDPKKLVSRFALHVLRSDLGQHQVRRYVKGSAQPGLNLRDVEVFWIPVPSLDEQHSIAGILDSHGEDIIATENELAKLYQLKSGLTTDLLTGLVPVPVDVVEAFP